MKNLRALLTFTVALTSANADSRLCPEGFTFLGDDGVDEAQFKRYWTEEISRTPTYSCYQINYANGGFNEAFSQCDDAKGHLLAVESTSELERLKMLFPKNMNETKTYLTSGFHFMDVNRWIWLGTNVTATTDNLTLIQGQESHPAYQCLSVKVIHHGEDMKIDFQATKCLDEAQYICEVRAQTVTYMAWFHTNWLTLLLTLMVTTLLVTLVVSLFKYNTKSRVYRGRHHSVGASRCQTAVNPTPFNDAPPSYKDVTGQKKESPMDKCRNKGKDILAKVTVYKNSYP